MNGEKEFLGRGWSFPPTFDNREGEVKMVRGVKDIDESLEILLSTSLGERVMFPEYGCNLRDFQFEPMNASLIGMIRDLVETAILYYEPRIEIENIEITDSGSQDAIEGRLIISVDYLVISTNSRYNFVYPFYLNEAIQEVVTQAQQR